MKKVIIPIIMVILIVLGAIGLTNKITHKKETPKETEKIIKPTKEKEKYKIYQCCNGLRMYTILE